MTSGTAKKGLRINTKAIRWTQNDLNKNALLGLSKIIVSRLEIPYNIIFSCEEYKRLDDFNKKEIIIKLARERGSFKDFPIDNLNWNDKKDEIWEIVKENRYCTNVPTNGIDWSDKKDEILVLARQRGGFRSLPVKSINWKGYKEKIWNIVQETKDFTYMPTCGIIWKDERNEILEMLRSSSNTNVFLQEGIDWNDKKDELLEIVKEKESFQFLKNIKIKDWNDKKDKILEILKEKMIFFDVITGVDWNDKKDEILSIAKKRESFDYGPVEGINWSDKKKDIWKIMKLRANFSKFPNEGIDWSDKKDEILLRAKESRNLKWLSAVNLDWNDRQDEVLDLVELIGSFVNVPVKNIEWLSDKKERISELAIRIGKVLGRMDEIPVEGLQWRINDWEQALKKVFPNVLNEAYINNPINSDVFFNSVIYDQGAWLMPELPNNVQRENQQEYLFEILDRLQRVGNNISEEVLRENEQLMADNIPLRINEKELIARLKFLDKDENAMEITALLLFYLNKLTKQHIQTIEIKALGDFQYDERFESGKYDETDPEYQAYIDQRDNAEKKANDILEGIRILKNRYEIFQKQKKNKKLSFDEFLSEYWIDDNCKNGLLEKGRLGNYGKTTYKRKNLENGVKEEANFIDDFNNTVKPLIEKYSFDEIRKIFLYGAKHFEIIEEGYNQKDILIHQLLEYAKDEKSGIIMGYAKDENGKEPYENVMYIYVNNFNLPFSCHFNVRKFDKALIDSIPKVSKEIISFHEDRANHIIFPTSEMERDTIKRYFEESPKKENASKIINDENNYKALVNITQDRKFNQNRDTYDEIIVGAYELLFGEEPLQYKKISFAEGKTIVDENVLAKFKNFLKPIKVENKSDIDLDKFLLQNPHIALAEIVTLIMEHREKSSEEKSQMRERVKTLARQIKEQNKLLVKKDKDDKKCKLHSIYNRAAQGIKAIKEIFFAKTREKVFFTENMTLQHVWDSGNMIRGDIKTTQVEK